MIRLAALVWSILAGAALADCRPVDHRGQGFVVCTADLSRDRISLHLTDPAGAVLGDFARLEAVVDGPVRFAMNGGMYHPDRTPVGLFVRDGVQRTPVVTRAGPGNFGMRPNGVLCIRDDAAFVRESRAFAADPPACRDATQSGPMLVVDGALHPRFIPDSPYRNVRNGVGATPDGRIVHFVISDRGVTFHEMATLFRDVLGVRDALYLDGRVSRLHAPALGRSDPGRAMGPILAVTER
ncbi:phosphodiester glycosidase family protein [Jannaschia sp. LMIT008]|uniref:phosphodiester glycosidase family protein n=1 Tax=Jannaschia maritima TaxID=3032585 RepID=UPI00281101AF|nr:phosphodiester glycosidase family protein [Jannaschia sp. LMIT008]